MEPKLRIYYLYFRRKYLLLPRVQTALILFFIFCFKTGFGENNSDTALNSLFWTAYSESRFDDAMEYGEKYSRVASKNNDPDEVFVALTNMFALYRRTGNYEKCFDYA